MSAATINPPKKQAINEYNWRFLLVFLLQ
jgi:hypothetical protein